MVKLIGLELYKKDIYGFCSIKFICYPDSLNTNENLALALGIDSYLNNYTNSIFYINIIT